ncbi:hypothetical protein H5410_027530 [Solanum commersonii]|uniref:Uncharacterized protein n=1 Tax=Solanum commersonii TaxID=4109 RepID=A0A9J5Z4Q6_SOLCO|nr:hypothetical protein H5410_027530 [Solanum commersonii]
MNLRGLWSIYFNAQILSLTDSNILDALTLNVKTHVKIDEKSVMRFDEKSIPYSRHSFASDKTGYSTYFSR